MKKRIGFVSNSSSSSFVVIDTKKGYDTIKGLSYEVGKEGESEFGWGIIDIKDIHSRINFAYLQTLEVGNVEQGNKWKQMLESAIKENSNVKEIEYLIDIDHIRGEGGVGKDKIWGYIDHQSSALEDENTEIFKNKDTLKDFIFGKGSYIHLDNDNR
jgi:hypothetical protein